MMRRPASVWWRLLFKDQYGASKLNYPLLGPEGPDQFNTIALRGNVRDAWINEWYGFGSATYIGDEWAKRAQCEQILSEALLVDGLEEARGDDLIGVDILDGQRDGFALEG